MCLKVAYFLRKIQTLRVSNSRIPRTKNAKFSEYYFYLNLSIYGDFQICISVPLKMISLPQSVSSALLKNSPGTARFRGKIFRDLILQL